MSMKLVPLLLAGAIPLWAELTTEFQQGTWNDNSWTSKKVTVVNSSAVPQYIEGMRFSCDYDVWRGDWTSPTTVINSDGAYRIQALFGNVEVNYSGNDVVQFEVTGTPGGVDATPYDPSYLVQNGSHFWPMEIPYAEPISVDEIDELMATADFYNESLGILDTLGQRGGAQNGGMIDTWYGLTQLQSALPTAPFNQNATWMTFEPKAYGNALYMMTLAAMQEYFNIDMQVLIAKGGKENMAGMVQWDSDGSGPTKKLNPIYATGNNGLSNVDFSPFSVEYQTFNDYVFNSYPKYFPLGTTTPAGSAANDYYSTTAGGGGFCQLNKPNVVNGTVIACLYNWFTYQIGLEATNYGFNELIAEGKDPQGPLKLALWAFNRGITCGWEATVASSDAFSYESIEEYPSIADNGRIYIEGIVQALNPIVEAARNSENLGGTEPIYDDTISLELIEQFLFGTGGNGTTGTSGEGGLLVHYTVSDEKKIQLWSDVEKAFEKLKGQAPSTQNEPEMISYRYDFLTVLRVIKQYIDTSIPLPTTYKFASWVDSKGSNSTTFGGEKRDEQFPVLKEYSIDSTSSLIVSVTATDNDMVKSVEWTMDRDLVTWRSAESVEGDVWDAHIANKAPTDADIGKPFTYWIRVTDDWGNAEIRSFEGVYRADGTSLGDNVLSSGRAIAIRSMENSTISISLPVESASLTLFNMRGQQLFRQKLFGKTNAVSVDRFPAGIYLCRVALPNGTSQVQTIAIR